MQIQNEGYYLQSAAKDALLNALLVAAKRFSSGPPQVIKLFFLWEDSVCCNVFTFQNDLFILFTQ